MFLELPATQPLPIELFPKLADLHRPVGCGLACGRKIRSGRLDGCRGLAPVSYTHLTLPTIYSV